MTKKKWTLGQLTKLKGKRWAKMNRKLSKTKFYCAECKVYFAATTLFVMERHMETHQEGRVIKIYMSTKKEAARRTLMEQTHLEIFSR